MLNTSHYKVESWNKQCQIDNWSREIGNLNVHLQMQVQIVKLQHRMPKIQAKFKSWILAEIERHIPEPFDSRAKAPPAKRWEKGYGDENAVTLAPLTGFHASKRRDISRVSILSGPFRPRVLLLSVPVAQCSRCSVLSVDLFQIIQFKFKRELVWRFVFFFFLSARRSNYNCVTVSSSRAL